MIGRISIAVLFFVGSFCVLLFPVQQGSPWQSEYHIVATTPAPPLPGGETEIRERTVTPAATLSVQRQRRRPPAAPAVPPRPIGLRLPRSAGIALPPAPALSSSEPRAPPVLC